MRSQSFMALSGFAAALAVLVGACPVARADQVINDDLIVTGNTCVSLDCVNGETFSGPSLKLKANNLRLRFIDTNASGNPGKTWSLMANDSANGGNSYFSFALQPIDTTTTSPDDPVPTHVLRLGVSGANSTAIGMDSEVVAGAVSVGNAGTLRRLVHVAQALGDTDALIKRQMEKGGLGARVDMTAKLEARVSALETEVSQLEADVDGGTASVHADGGTIQPWTLLLLACLAVVGRLRTMGTFVHCLRVRKGRPAKAA